MKLNLALLVISSASAFAPRASFVRTSSSVWMQDTSEAVKNALEVSEKMGKTSPEARVAWDLVEEMDAANSHEKQLRQEIERKQAEIEALIKKAEEEKLASATAPAVHRDTSAAVKKALEMSRVHGKTSVEARMAWEEVEEMDAANSHHKSDGAPSVAEEEVDPPASSVEKAKGTQITVEEAISNALLLSKVYGKQAPQTRLAWELVEEMEARDSRKRAQLRAALEKQQAKESADKRQAEEASSQDVLHIDSSTAIQAAMEASEKYGKTSVEARIAWELVEEIDATNAHHKTVGSG